MRKRLWSEPFYLKEVWLVIALCWGPTSEAGPAKSKGAPSSKRARDTQPRSPSLTEQMLAIAESKASENGKAVLRTGKEMVENQEIGSKGCWDYINKIYSRAGFPTKKRAILYEGKKRGPYANLQDLQPGDWLYYVNHSYHGIEHSAIFVDWVSRERNDALMLSYAGEDKNEVARYKTYNLSSVYRIVRPHSPEQSRTDKTASKRVANR